MLARPKRYIQRLLMGCITFSLLLSATSTTLAVTETDAPPCRWDTRSVSYGWGINAYQGTEYRAAYEQSIPDWNNAGTPIQFSYSSAGRVLLEIYYQNDNRSGYAQPYCNGSRTMNYDVFANNRYKSTDANRRRAVTGHELGHANGVGHIGGTVIALLGNNPDPSRYYIPQKPDVDLIKQVYP